MIGARLCFAILCSKVAIEEYLDILISEIYIIKYFKLYVSLNYYELKKLKILIFQNLNSPHPKYLIFERPCFMISEVK